MSLEPVHWVNVVVPVLALLFTVASFWWIYLRRGWLKLATVPSSFGLVSTTNFFRLCLPLVIFNSGAATLAVEELQIAVEGHRFRWISFRRGLRLIFDS